MGMGIWGVGREMVCHPSFRWDDDEMHWDDDATNTRGGARMKIKTYTVGSLSEAVEQIKRDLGPQAVILSTKKVAGPGTWFAPKKTKLEVTAAIDMEPQAAVMPEALRPQNGQRMFQRIAEEQLTPIRGELKEIRDALLALATAAAAPRAQPAPAAVPVLPMTVRETSAGVIALPMRSAGSAPDIAPIRRRTADAPSEQEMIRQALHDTPAPSVASDARSNMIARLCESLIWHHVDPDLIERLANELTQGEPVYSPALLQEQAAAWLMQQLPVAKPFAGIGDARVIALVGPTGSGKTTTLVKLASQLLFEHKLRVGFITLDQFRVGAEEQLRKYAQILEVPCELATTAVDFETALARLADLDVVLVDTTGRSPQDTDGLRAIYDTLQCAPKRWVALVLPATLHGQDLLNTAHHFAALAPDRLILTKLDEAISFGSLLNAQLATGLSPAYFTTGQQVPEDIEAATKDRVIDCLLNLSGNFPIPDVPRIMAGEESAASLGLTDDAETPWWDTVTPATAVGGGTDGGGTEAEGGIQ